MSYNQRLRSIYWPSAAVRHHLNGGLGTDFFAHFWASAIQMDLVIKSTGALFLLLAWAGLIPFEQLLITLVAGYLLLGSDIALAGPPVY